MRHEQNTIWQAIQYNLSEFFKKEIAKQSLGTYPLKQPAILGAVFTTLENVVSYTDQETLYSQVMEANLSTANSTQELVKVASYLSWFFLIEQMLYTVTEFKNYLDRMTATDELIKEIELNSELAKLEKSVSARSEHLLNMIKRNSIDQLSLMNVSERERELYLYLAQVLSELAHRKNVVEIYREHERLLPDGPLISTFTLSLLSNT